MKRIHRDRFGFKLLTANLLSLKGVVSAATLTLLAWHLLAELPGDTTTSLAYAQVTGPVVVVTIDGTINPATDDYLKTSMAQAQADNARLMVVRLNTPGGLLNSMQSMVAILLQAPVPTVVYVYPSGGSATSAGVFITMAGHFAVMAPSTTIGAAHPVQGSGDSVQGDLRAKIENFAASFARSVAEGRGRNAQWAEKAVRESVSITDREALENKVIDFIAADLDRLLAELEGKQVNISGRLVTLSGLTTAPRVVLEMNLKQKVVNVLADPNIAIVLGLAAMLGIVMELYHPGVALPGIIGIICLVLSLTASQVIPINYGGLGLLILGVVFILVELFVPSFGVWGIAGGISFVIGAIYVVDSEKVWSSSGFAVSGLLIGACVLLVSGLVFGMSWVVAKSRAVKISTGSEGMVGLVGVVKEAVVSKQGRPPLGKVMVAGELWKAASKGESSSFPVGTKVKIIAVREGMVLEVEQFENE